MKQIIWVILFSFSALAMTAQAPATTGTTTTSAEPTTTKLPVGTFQKSGKIYLSPGYGTIKSKDGKTVTVAKMIAGGGFGATSGSFDCRCTGTGTDDCTTTTAGGDINCSSKDGKCSGCTMFTTTDPKLGGIAIAPDYSSTKLGGLVWKKFVFAK